MSYDEDIKESLATLRNGGIILYPTDTIWGLGCDPTDAAAIEKIFRIKSRSESKSLIILADSIQMVERYVSVVPDIVYELTEVSDKPLTIIYPKGKNLTAKILSEDGSLAIRICKEAFCNELIKRFRKPIVSTSANYSGNRAPENFSDIEPSLIELVDYAVKYRQNDRNKYSASSVIKIEENGIIKIIRE